LVKRYIPRTLLFTCLLVACGANVCAQTPEDINFLAGLTDFEHVSNMLPYYLNRIGFELLDRRERAVSQISTAADVAKRKIYIRERILGELGGLPDRTPLNARVVGTLDRGGYRVEKLIFESQPRF
jgi:hypothetical protein